MVNHRCSVHPPNAKSRPKAVLAKRRKAGLDAQAELAGLLFTGMSVKIVWIAVVELVTAKQFAPHEEAHRSHGQPHREPANHLQSAGFLRFFASLIFGGWGF